MFKATNWDGINAEMYGNTYADGDEMLRELYAKIRSIHKIAKLLRLSSHTVHQKIRKLGLETNRRGKPDWYKSPQWKRLDQEMEETHRNEPLVDMERRLGINRNTISKFRKKRYGISYR